MIVNCPNCGTKFNLNPDVLGDAGKRVKCKECQETWLQKPEGDKPSDIHVIDEKVKESRSSKELAQDILKKQGRKLNVEINIKDIRKKLPNFKEFILRRQDVSIFLSLLFVTLVVAVMFSKQIMNSKPMAEYFYNKIGIKSKIVGEDILFKDLTAKKVMKEGKQELLVEFNLVNNSDHIVDYPSIKIHIEDDGEVLKEWSLNARKGEFLTASLSKPMKMQFGSIPDNAKKIFIKVKYSELDKKNIEANILDKPVIDTSK